MRYVYIVDIFTKSGLYTQRKVFLSKLKAYDFGKSQHGFEFVLKREKVLR